MLAFSEILIQSLEKVWVTFTHNWPFLLISILISVALRLYINPEKVSDFLTRYRRVGVVGATAAAVTTPFCSCGTTAVILGMIASTIPWAPIVAFMVASPLTSPEELIYSAGIFGWPFAIAFFVSSILLGLLGGAVAEFIEARGWLVNQTRFQQQPAPVSKSLETQPALAMAGSAACACQPTQPPVHVRDIRVNRPVLAVEMAAGPVICCGPAIANPPSSDCGCSATHVVNSPAACGCGSQEKETGLAQAAEHPLPAAKNLLPAVEPKQPVTLRRWVEELYRTGKQLLVMFLGFAFIGYVLNGLIPPAWITAIFGAGNAYSVPLAATLGLPLYINTEGSLPLVRALIDGGMSQGAALAFLITGAGTSFGAVAGALTIARWRVIGLVVGTLWVGAVILGYLYDVLLAAHLF